MKGKSGLEEPGSQFHTNTAWLTTWTPDAWNEMCSQENCTKTNKSRVESNSIYDNQLNPVRNSTSVINSHFWLWVRHKVEKPILSSKF